MDAIQSLTGCTYGKGNLFHLDYGKNAFTFIRRSDGKAIRIITRPEAWGEPNPAHQTLRQKVFSSQASEEEEKQFRQQHLARAQWVLERPLPDLFTVTPVAPEIPARARIHNSVTCADCGESTMETRSRLFRGEHLCIPCFEARDRRY